MTLKTSTNSPDDPLAREISPFDADAEPEDLAAMERELSKTTEDGCCDMPLEGYDPGMFAKEERLAAEMEQYALAEPEPPGFAPAVPLAETKTTSTPKETTP